MIALMTLTQGHSGLAEANKSALNYLSNKALAISIKLATTVGPVNYTTLSLKTFIWLDHFVCFVLKLNTWFWEHTYTESKNIIILWLKVVNFCSSSSVLRCVRKTLTDLILSQHVFGCSAEAKGVTPLNHFFITQFSNIWHQNEGNQNNAMSMLPVCTKSLLGWSCRMSQVLTCSTRFHSGVLLPSQCGSWISRRPVNKPSAYIWKCTTHIQRKRKEKNHTWKKKRPEEKKSTPTMHWDSYLHLKTSYKSLNQPHIKLFTHPNMNTFTDPAFYNNKQHNMTTSTSTNTHRHTQTDRQTQIHTHTHTQTCTNRHTHTTTLHSTQEHIHARTHTHTQKTQTE